MIQDPKEEATSSKVLSKQCINVEGAEKTKWYTTTSSQYNRKTETNNIWISWIWLGFTSGYVGDIRKDQTKILVEEYVQGHNEVHRKL